MTDAATPVSARPRWGRRAAQGALAAASSAVMVASVLGNGYGNTILKGSPPATAAADGATGTATAAPSSRPDVTRGIPTASRPPTIRSKAMNILVLGIDSRDGLTRAQQDRYHLGTVGEGSSDTIMLVHLAADGTHATIVSFPRDLYVEIPEFMRSDGMFDAARKMKINAAYPRGGPDGPNLAIYTIEKLSGIHIDHYMSIDIPQLGSMVNALGGVDVCLPKAVQDTDSGLNLPAGVSHLDDVQAVAYVRDRHTETGDGAQDFGRIRRQQKFVSALFNKVVSAGTLTDIGKLTRVINVFAQSVRMDNTLDGKALFTIASSLQSLDSRHVTFTTVPVSNDNFFVPGVGSTMTIDETPAQRLFSDIRNDRPITADPATATATATGSASHTPTPTATTDRTHTAADDPCARSNG